MSRRRNLYPGPTWDLQYSRNVEINALGQDAVAAERYRSYECQEQRASESEQLEKRIKHSWGQATGRNMIGKKVVQGWPVGASVESGVNPASPMQ